MAGFSADWLALREPADHASINAGLRRIVRERFAGRDQIRIVDLGSGTGSNLRGLSPDLPPNQHWTLVDYDAGLLAHARAPAAGVTIETRCADLSSGDIADLIRGADLVTASALFDLVSGTVIDRMAQQIAASGAAFYTVLTYDGIATWLPETPRNSDMRTLFNRHQKSDKGFGPAAGPDATSALAAAFSTQNYNVLRGRSPWVLAAESATLRDAVDEGWAGAVVETGDVSRADADAWLAARRGSAKAVTIVGHEDLLALPPAA